MGFLIQFGIFILLLVGLRLASKKIGKNNIYFFIAISTIVLAFVLLNTKEFGDRTFLFVIFFGAVCIVSIIKLLIRELKNT